MSKIITVPRRGPGTHAKRVPIRRHYRRPPREKTIQDLALDYQKAGQRLWRALLQPIRPPRITRRRNGWRSGRGTARGRVSGGRLCGVVRASRINSARLQTWLVKPNSIAGVTRSVS